MSKVKPLLPGPVATARRVLDECKIAHPREIHVEAIAARYGAMVLYRPLATAAGTIVRTARRAVINVDEAQRGTARGDFTAAHECGHHLLHAIDDHFRQCEGEDADPDATPRETTDAKRRRFEVEREANHFATELRMPERWAAPLCAAPRPTLDDVERIARTFRTSFHASAIRFIELTSAPCALVRSIGGVIKRSTETDAFPGRIVMRRPLDPRSLATSLQSARAGSDGEPREVAGEAWGWEKGGSFVEHAIALGPELGVMSWIVPMG